MLTIKSMAFKEHCGFNSRRSPLQRQVQNTIRLLISDHYTWWVILELFFAQLWVKLRIWRRFQLKDRPLNIAGSIADAVHCKDSAGHVPRKLPPKIFVYYFTQHIQNDTVWTTEIVTTKTKQSYWVVDLFLYFVSFYGSPVQSKKFWTDPRLKQNKISCLFSRNELL